ncbi:MAG TPA: tRNA-dihydrouridine synthase [Candidatus Paceibacterota bacterium]|nr:tRNA-dihydrouridine synthase [Candidatus Paceibacterota bacterium]
MKNFWEKLNKPFFVLAPMADVTDIAFRQVIGKYGKPDVFWTEFVSADGLAHPKAREKLLIDLRYEKNEHPIVAQIFGSNPDNIRYAASLCTELGFDGVDINMGCPDRSVEKQGAGACMIKNPEIAKAVIEAAREGVKSSGKDIPVSVKTRIGYNKNEINTWIRFLLELDLPVLTVHLRTRKEMSLVPAHWELMKDIVALRDELGKKTLIIGNGDAVDIKDAKKKVKESGCDGVMLGRAIFGNPWLFSGKEPKNTKEKLKVMIEHTKLFEQKLGEHKNFAIMKKHYKAYVNGFDGAKELRMRLMESETVEEIEQKVADFLKNHPK